MKDDRDNQEVLDTLISIADSTSYAASENFIAVWGGSDAIYVYDSELNMVMASSIHTSDKVRRPTEHEAIERMEEVLEIQENKKNNEQVSP